MKEIPFLRYFGYTILLFALPSKLAEIDAKRNINIELKNNKGFKDKSNDQDFLVKQTAAFKTESLVRIKEMRKSISKALIIAIIVFISSFVAALLMLNIVGRPSGKTLFYFRLISSFILLSAIFFKVGRPLHSIGAKTIPENLDEFLFKYLSSLSIWFILFTYFWQHIQL